MKPKVRALLERGHRLRIVHPIAVDRWIVQVEADGTFLTRRRSPRHGALADIASELITFRSFWQPPGSRSRSCSQPRRSTGILCPGCAGAAAAGRCSSGGWSTCSIGSCLAEPADLARLLPAGLPATFTTADLAAGLGRPRRVAQHVAYCLAKARVIEGRRQTRPFGCVSPRPRRVTAGEGLARLSMSEASIEYITQSRGSPRRSAYRRSSPSRWKPAFTATRPDGSFPMKWYSSSRGKPSQSSAHRPSSRTASVATPRPRSTGTTQ
jgi:hypothetical protein